MLGLDCLHSRLANLHTGVWACLRIPAAAWDHTDPWVVVLSHQRDHSEGHPLVDPLVACLEVEATIEMMIPWKRDSRHEEVDYQMLELELPLSLWTLGLEG